jgi:hypothetical protein
MDKLSTDLQAFSTPNGQEHLCIWRPDSIQRNHSKNVQEYGWSCFNKQTLGMYLNSKYVWYVIYLVEEMSVLSVLWTC